MSCVLHLPTVPSVDDAADASPYALHNFLPIGALLLATSAANHSSCADHWHTYPTAGSAIFDTEDDKILRILDFLILHKFVAATCRLGTTLAPGTFQLCVRLYLIPYDLTNVEGVLRRRDEALVLQPARRYMRALLARVTCHPASWRGDTRTISPNESQPFCKAAIDGRTLAEIFNALPSPTVEQRVNNLQDEFGRIAHEVLHRPVPGMRSTLHQYQRRSVIAMAQRELRPDAILDPLYVPIHGIDGRTFFLQPATMEVLQFCPTVSQSRGGILCEELGTGKTVMILGLVLATVDHLPAPEESILDPRPVLTPLALRHFTSHPFSEARQRLAHGNGRKGGDSPSSRIPSLVELLLHYSRIHPDALSIRHSSDNFPLKHLWGPYRRNVPYYHHYEEEPLDVLRTSRKKKDVGPKVMYLTSATLIVVPPNLLNQWSSEINKHCDDRLAVYRATERNALPSARTLATNYDIILMTHARLGHEATKMNIPGLHSWKRCQCPILANSSVRVPDCRCKPPAGVSPLLQIRWKRLVIDEGHVLSTLNTNLMTLIRNMSIERKWIVTGTPTTNMMGLHLRESRDKNDAEIDECIADTLRKKLLHDTNDMNPASQSDREEDRESDIDMDGIDLEYPEEEVEVMAILDAEDAGQYPMSARRWTKTDRTDLTKLGNMISSYLEVPQFAADGKLFQTHVIAPLMDPSGPRFGSLQVVTQVMQSVMIRHRIEDIEQEISLPPLRQETILLDLDPYAVMTYNVMQATIVINAVDSERTGSDYFFHATNSIFLQQLIENLSQAMFWHVDERAFNIKEIIEETPNFLAKSSKKLAEGRIPQADFDMLVEALRLVQSAANDPVWGNLQMHPNVFSRVYNLPRPVYDAWSVLPSNTDQLRDAHSSGLYYLVNPDRLKTLKNFMLRKPLASVSRIVEYGETVAYEEDERYRFNVSRARVNKGLRNLKKRKEQHAKVGSGKADIDATAAARTGSTAKMLEAQDKMKALLAGADEDIALHPTISSLHRLSPLVGVTIGNSTSSKLDYILNEVRQYASTDKFLIFSRSPLTLLYIAEALAMMSVQYKLSSQQPVKVMEQDVMTFESSDTFRVFLLELKHGSRGLNLVAASRVIFCEPVWQADVETQAIKRVHRIGQVSPVTVKTLAIRSTAEEFMVKRREDLKQGLGTAGGKLPNLADDISMRNFIANPTFLPDPPPPAIILSCPFLTSSPPSSRAHSQSAERVNITPASTVQPPLPIPRIRTQPSATATSGLHSAPSSTDAFEIPTPKPIPLPVFGDNLMSRGASSSQSSISGVHTDPALAPVTKTVRIPRIPALKRKAVAVDEGPSVSKRARDDSIGHHDVGMGNPLNAPEASVQDPAGLVAPQQVPPRVARVRFATPPEE